jgi:hypothetical protein
MSIYGSTTLVDMAAFSAGGLLGRGISLLQGRHLVEDIRIDANVNEKRP